MTPPLMPVTMMLADVPVGSVMTIVGVEVNPLPPSMIVALVMQPLPTVA